MKLDSYNRDVITNGGQTTNFEMEMNGVAYTILSDSLYQHKIAAIVRELSCNAYDSMKESGREHVPFKITLPNNLSSQFTIADTGLGLDDTGVRKVFGAYFRSTKTDTNDLTGGMGIGSKSIFAYTDSGTITAVKDGVTRKYAMLIGEEGIPQVQILFEKETPNEENGVSISINVKSQDYDRFMHETAVIGAMFPTQPEVVGRQDFEFIEIDMGMIQTEGFTHLRSTESTLYSGEEAYALMGNVLYPIPSYLINQSNHSDFLNAMVSRGALVVPFEIGELIPAASRESLSIKERHEALIKDRMESLIEKKKTEVQPTLDSFDHFLDGVQYLTDTFNSFAFRLGFNWRGKAIHTMLKRQIKFPANSLVYRVKHSYRRGYYLSGERVMRFDELRNGRHEAHFVYNDGDFSKNRIQSNFKVLLNAKPGFMSEGDYVVITTSNLPNRFERYTNGAFKCQPASGVIEEAKNYRNAPTHSGITYDRGEKTENTIYCKLINKDGLQKVHHHEVSDTTKYFYATYDEIISDTKFLGDDVVVLIANDRNRKRIENITSNSLEEYLREKKNELRYWIRLREMLTDYFAFTIESDGVSIKQPTSSYLDIAENGTLTQERYQKFADRALELYRGVVEKRSEGIGVFQWVSYQGYHHFNASDEEEAALRKIKMELKGRDENLRSLVRANYNAYGVTSLHTKTEKNQIRMIDFCRENGFDFNAGE